MYKKICNYVEMFGHASVMRFSKSNPKLSDVAIVLEIVFSNLRNKKNVMES
ncbi:hypothetical protein Fmac_003060 [Flemingia macrophylla]|uniref:Uncharacterized protein n=1 Tax=Flemingia macrophylla TaxID=520843 RepID=A0ABD1NLR5_9FABA